MADDTEGHPLVWEAVEAVQLELGGETYSIVPGTPGTTFADGHPVVRAHPQYFKPFKPQYDWAPRNASSAAQRGARSR